MSYLPSRQLFIASVAMALLVLAVLVGCSLDPLPDPTPSPPAPTATPLPRGGNLTIGLAADVPELRPWQPRSRGEEQITALLYRGLTQLDAQLQPQPDLASGWDASLDGRLITFTLRSGLTWHDGKPLTSDDVAYTLNALNVLSPTTALLSDLHRIAEITTPATNTVVLSLTERYAPIFSELTVPILPKHVLIGKDIATFNFWDAPVGSGPFQFAGHVAGTSVTLAANKRYYRGQPLFDRVAFLVASSPQVTLSALKDGRLSLAELPWSEGKTVTQTIPGIHAGAYPENGYYFLAFNTRQGRPFADARVRQALAEAIDTPRLVRDVTDGQGMLLGSSAAPGSWADLTKAATTTLNLDHARTLLDEAGWKLPDGGAIRQQNGITLTAQLFVRGDDARRVRAAELIAGSAQQLGISVTVQRADFASVIISKYAPPYDFDLLLGSWTNGAGDPTFADYAFYDPDDFALFHSSQVNQGLLDTRPVRNIAGFSDPAYDNQAAAARQLYDFAERARAIQQAQARIAELKPYIYLWDDRIAVALNAHVTTLDGPVNLATPMYLNNLERWYLRK
jgi:peptide/nickel transport system substrate-binding protein